MNEFGLKGKIFDEDFLIHVLNNVPKEYNVIFDGLKNCPMASENNEPTITMIRKKINHW